MPPQTKALPIDGASVTTFDRFGDHRGYFNELYNEEKYDGLSAPGERWKQVSFSSSQKHALRGLHCSPHGKFITCVRGSFYDVIADFRDGEEPIFGVMFDGGFAMGNDLDLYNAGEREQVRDVTTSTGEKAQVGGKGCGADVAGALEALRRMRQVNQVPNVQTWHALLNACAKAQVGGPGGGADVAAAAVVLSEMEALGVELQPDPLLGALVHVYANAQVGGMGGGADLEGAWAAVRKAQAAGASIPLRAWNSLMTASANAQVGGAGGGADIASALRVLDEMSAAGVAPDIVTWGALARAYQRAQVGGPGGGADAAGALSVLDRMRAAKVRLA